MCRPMGRVPASEAGERAHTAGIEAIPLSPRLGDFNGDIRELGIDALRAALRIQIVPEDVTRFMALAA